MHDKWLCTNRRCHWVGPTSGLLSAPDPFNEGQTLHACPECRDSSSLAAACDEPGCAKPVSCGTPTEAGYRNTCYEHMPKEKA